MQRESVRDFTCSRPEAQHLGASEASLRPWPRSAAACLKMGPARDPFAGSPSRPRETWQRRHAEQDETRAMGISRPGFAETSGPAGRLPALLTSDVVPWRAGTPTASRTDRLPECLEVNLSGFSEERCSEPYEPSARADGPRGITLQRECLCGSSPGPKRPGPAGVAEPAA